ncbi:hypothetical protein [Candidatus Electronema sp. PJ]|uniref:hypothetical protein n=1 Tax=Candidatus Electronema sp. PJ TaxID=3401572 RepID=UPI003AA9A956
MTAAKKGNCVKVHYTGTLEDGRMLGCLTHNVVSLAVTCDLNYLVNHNTFAYTRHRF